MTSDKNIGCLIRQIMASPQQSGYQCQFVDSVKDYECPLCLHVTREPFLTSCCGQHFCQVCISRIHTDNKPCPFCKSTGFSTFFDKKQKRRVLDLKVYCDKRTEECQWVGGLGELEKHLGENCQFFKVNCPNNCGLAIQRQLLAKHQANDCLKRPHSCQYCQLNATYREIQDNHLPVCPKYPVPCPNKCGVSPQERDQLEDHLRECPLQLVECELWEMGCEEMVKRKDLTRHMEEGAQKHLILMASKYLKTQADMHQYISELKRENEGLKREAMQKERQISDLNCQICLIKQHLHMSTTQIYIDYITLKKKIDESAHTLLSMITRKRWVNYTTFHTSPSNCEMRVNLFPGVGRLEIELTHVNSVADDGLQWPKKFSMTVRLVNQAGDHDHYQVTRDVKVNRGSLNNDIYIPYSTIENPPRGVQYVKNEHITLQILVIEK